MTPQPTRREWRAAIRYVRAQMRIMFPTRHPQRHPEYRRLVQTSAQIAAEARAHREGR
jgi:hypothetical protein